MKQLVRIFTVGIILAMSLQGRSLAMEENAKIIVAIGGGDTKNDVINKEIVSLSGKSKPNFLFVPTASDDDAEYVIEYKKIFRDLGCATDALLLLNKRLTKDDIKQKIGWADIIFVGGGNTLKMMKCWRRLGVDKLLKEAYEKGTVMCGRSAGSICWFDAGHSDSHSYEKKRKSWQYIKVSGLGLLPEIHCPHFDSYTEGEKPRSDSFKEMMKKNSSKVGIAIDDNCAIVFKDDLCRVIASKATANAYKVFSATGEVKVQPFEKEEEYRPAF